MNIDINNINPRLLSFTEKENIRDYIMHDIDSAFYNSYDELKNALEVLKLLDLDPHDSYYYPRAEDYSEKEIELLSEIFKIESTPPSRTIYLWNHNGKGIQETFTDLSYKDRKKAIKYMKSHLPNSQAVNNDPIDVYEAYEKLFEMINN